MATTQKKAQAQSGLEIKDREKTKYQRYTALVLIFLGLIYGFFFLPESVLDIIQSKLKAMQSWVGTLIGTGASGIAAVLIGEIVMAQDLLATSSLSAAKFFRAQYPSNFIMSFYPSCSKPEANELWFFIFNQWSSPTHSRYQKYVQTFQRSYSCRLIFHVRWCFLLFLVAEIITLIVSLTCHLETTSISLLYSRLFIALIFLIITVLLFLCNRVSSAETGTGCWERWHEINHMHKSWLEEAVFNRASTYSEALALVKEASWRKECGS
jgi:hypothetical protein